MENAIAQRIKECLTAKRWTVNQLSKALELSQPTVSRQISGSVALGSELCVGMLRVFPSLSAEWLMRGTGQMEGAAAGADSELRDVCVDQACEILRLKLRIQELEDGKKSHA